MTSFKTLATGSLLGLALSLSAVPAFAGDVEFREEMLIVQLARTGHHSKIVNKADDRATAVVGISSIQAIQESEVKFREESLVAQIARVDGDVINIADDSGLAVVGIASIQSMRTGHHH